MTTEVDFPLTLQLAGSFLHQLVCFFLSSKRKGTGQREEEKYLSVCGFSELSFK